MIPETKKTWAGKCHTVTLGATAAEGGSRTSVVKIGGASTLPFLHFEGTVAETKVGSSPRKSGYRDRPRYQRETRCNN